MKLKKFIKNKKIKTMFVGSIIGIILIIGGITLYRTFALYEEKKTFDILKGTVPDFVYKEDILNGAYPVLKSKTGEKLIPVTIDEDDGTVRKADIKDEWYKYEEMRWANAVILVDGAKEPKNDETIPEDQIESYFVWIPKYKYKIFDMGNYESLQEGELTSKAKAVEIEFDIKDTQDNKEGECATPNKSGEDGQCDVGDWMTHPAFTAFSGSHGMWVGKFETGYKQDGEQKNWTKEGAQSNTQDSTKVIIKPNVYSWRNITVGNAYHASYEYQRELDSHMMKNTEWGAAAYLSHSKYGTCSGETCTEVRINNSNNYVTGYAAKNITTTGYNLYKDYGSVSPGHDAEESSDFKGAYNYNNQKSTLASTTGNYTGIYDMSGSAWEYVAGVMTNATSINDLTLKNIEFEESSGFKETGIIDLKYIDLYLKGTQIQHNRRILGDATGEMGPFAIKTWNSSERKVNSWYDDGASFLTTSNIYFGRGGAPLVGSESGLFAYYGYQQKYTDHTFRIVLTPQT